ncbi:hypothetical protein KKF69_06970 [Patescibacteria group bacterium]|nr:hypothetical protein [Patescibacteria group bacterium]MBU4017184.1 hypothetical protein [Patescibacteria group bacterium]
MSSRSEKLNTAELPNWIPDKVRRVLKKETLQKEPIDLSSPEIIGKYFANKEEIKDVIDYINPIENPILIGMDGNRAKLKRPPLFETEKSFKKYHKAKTMKYGLSTEDYENARKFLKKGFNDGYKQGEKYSKSVGAKPCFRPKYAIILFPTYRAITGNRPYN